MVELQVQVAHQAWELVQVVQGRRFVEVQRVKYWVVVRVVLPVRWATSVEGLPGFHWMSGDPPGVV